MWSNRKPKVFCIGLSKTGTTSLEQVYKDLGYKIGNQRAGELLIEDWAKRDFRRIIKLCKTADAFQDLPFSLPYTFQVLDHQFPNARFILTVRDTPEQWYNSLIRFHGKIWGKNGRTPPSIEDLKEATYIAKGRPFRVNRLIFPTPIKTPYQKDILIRYYENHLATVKDYFRHSPDKLICINISVQGDYARLCRFLGKQPVADDFPWLNRT